MYGSAALLFVLSLCSVTLCQEYAYHFISESKTWEEARLYCTGKYSDLASGAQVDMCGSAGNCTGAWIGLKQENNSWSWSGRHDVSWRNDNCTFLYTECEHNASCRERSWFICYNHSYSDQFTYGQVHNNISLKKALEVCQGAHDRCWIGLLRDTWKWSDGNNSSFRNWMKEDYIQHRSIQKCARLTDQKTWMSDNCSDQRPFICYDNHMILVKESKTWEEALYHCRSYHGDLAMMTNEHQRRMVQERANMAASEFVWVGLYYTCFLEAWVWVDGHYVSEKDKNWQEQVSHECGVAGAMKKAGGHKWYEEPAWRKYQFVCSVKC